MWKNRIKRFVWEDNGIPETPLIDSLIESDDKITKALAHYCEVCERGFKTIGATKLHKKFKHNL